MPQSERAVQVGGAWLAVASFLMIAVLVLHGPIPPSVQERMARIAGAAAEWSTVHWIAAAALSLYAVSGLIMLTSGSRLTAGPWTLTAWAVVCVGALWTVTTAIAETTVVARAAISGSEETFLAWWAFAEAHGSGFAFFALAVAVIAGGEARHPAGATPTWAARIAMLAGIGSFTGWALGIWLGIAPGNLLWVISSIVMSLWTLWLGTALLRDPAGAVRPAGEAAGAGARPRRGTRAPRRIHRSDERGRTRSNTYQRSAPRPTVVPACPASSTPGSGRAARTAPSPISIRP